MSEAEQRLWELRELVLATTGCDSVTEAMVKYRKLEQRLAELENRSFGDKCET